MTDPSVVCDEFVSENPTPATNTPTQSGTRLDTAVGKGFSVITAILPTGPKRDLATRRHALLHYAEPGTPLAEWLHHGRARAAIVRPDFTVLRAGEDLSELCAALSSFGRG